MKLHCLSLHSLFILDQLYLEETLLRHSKDNWCLVNRASPPAVVTGISAKVNEWVNLDNLESTPLIRRYSGGGTVSITPDTLFVTFIFNRSPFDEPLFPETIMRWSAQWYAPLFPSGLFSLCENDYRLNDRKCGGNAQYLTKERFVHHTSWLWNFSKEQMALLKSPPRMPTYRKNRLHEDFLTPIHPHFPSQDAFFERLFTTLAQQFDCIHSTTAPSLPPLPVYRTELLQGDIPPQSPPLLH